MVLTNENKNIIGNSNTYVGFVEKEGEDFLKQVERIAIHADLLKKIVGEQNARMFMEVNVKNAVDEWLHFEDGTEKTKIIIDTNSVKLNSAINKILGFPCVQTIYEFKHGDRFDLWIVVNDYTMETCKKIYDISYELNEMDIIILEKEQLNVSEMPAPIFVFEK